MEYQQKNTIMKNYSLAFIMGLLCLIIGFLCGRYSNDIGKYTIGNYDGIVVIFDTSTGVYYARTDGGIIKRNTIQDYKIIQENKAKTKKNK